jgi:3-hydroxybutyryl-CoA dehydrogenase
MAKPAKTNARASDPEPNIVVLDDGFPAALWKERLAAAGARFAHISSAGEEREYPFEPMVVIETEDVRRMKLLDAYNDLLGEDDDWDDEEWEDELEDIENGHAEDEDEEGAEVEDEDVGDLAPQGIMLLPCYNGSPTEMAQSVDRHRDRIVGYTLFPRPEDGGGPPTIELALPMQAAPDILEKALAFTRAMGFAPEAVGDSPGLVFGRALACVINEAASALQEGVARAEEIDAAMRLGLNYPRGPFEWADRLGIEFVVEILSGLHEHYREERYRPHPLLRHMEIAGKMFLPPAPAPRP